MYVYKPLSLKAYNLTASFQPALLESNVYKTVKAGVDERSVFASTGENQVSEAELDAYAGVVTNYKNWVGQVKTRSSHLKATWFTGGLVAPPMLELVKNLARDSLTRSYVFDW